MNKSNQLPLFVRDPNEGVGPELCKLINSICKANGFSLAKTREIRAKLREIANSSRAYKKEIGFNDNADLRCAFIWERTKERYSYWSSVCR